MEKLKNHLYQLSRKYREYLIYTIPVAQFSIFSGYICTPCRLYPIVPFKIMDDKHPHSLLSMLYAQYIAISG